MKTIVAPTDFSAISLNAVNYAADLAGVIGTDLSLIYVCPIPMSFSEVPASAYNVTELVADGEEQMKLLKEKVLHRTRKRIRINTEVRQGNVVSEIANYCSSLKPYAVVMGAESAGSFERLLMGGKTVSAMRQLSWPLIIVPPEIEFAGIRKIGLACDFRKVLETIPVKEITSLVKKFRAEFHVLHVSDETGDSFSSETIEQSAWFHDSLGDLNPKYRFIGGTDVENLITQYAEKNNLDLLIIIPKKHTLIKKIFQHSHSKRLMLHTHVPVLAIHE